jgi:hypothetical protein
VDLEGAVRAVAAWGVAGPPAGDGLKVSPEDWPVFLESLWADRLTGLALAATEAAWLVLAEDQLDELLERQREAMLWALALERRLLELAEAFDTAGVGFVVLKGPTLAHTVYPDPSWRPFGDIDLLVRTRDWRRALALLERLGLRRRLPEPRKGFDERFGKAATHVTDRGEEIDLHRTLVLGPFGLWMDPEELFDRTVPFELAGTRVRRLDDTGLMAHACIHAALGLKDPHLLTVRDVAQVAARGDVDWNVLADWARLWRLAVVIRHAFDSATRLLGIAWPVQLEAAVTAPSGRREQRALKAHTTDRRAKGGTAIATLAAIPGLRAKASYVRGLVWPDREFLIARSDGLGGRSHVRRWMVPVRWMRSRR